MNNIKTDSNNLAIRYDVDVGDNVLRFQKILNAQQKEIFQPEGRLIAYLSVLCLFGIITAILYFLFF
jgi:hypothetical protein